VRRIAALIVLVAAAATRPVWAQERQYLVAGERSALPDRAAIAAAGGTWVDEIASIGVAIVRSSNPEFLALVKSDPSVALASPDFEAQLPATQLTAEEEAELTAAAVELSFEETQELGDPFYNLQWAHRAMGVTEAHARGITGEGVRVAVVDGGIDCLHEDPGTDASRVFRSCLWPTAADSRLRGNRGTRRAFTARRWQGSSPPPQTTAGCSRNRSGGVDRSGEGFAAERKVSVEQGGTGL
jgi:hypothetical protein